MEQLITWLVTFVILSCGILSAVLGWNGDQVLYGEKNKNTIPAKSLSVLCVTKNISNVIKKTYLLSFLLSAIASSGLVYGSGAVGKWFITLLIGAFVYGVIYTKDVYHHIMNEE
jgi:MFS family permease